MNNNNKKRVYHRFASGWLKTTQNGKEYVSAVANGEKDKVKLFAELENGTILPITNFSMNFNEEKPSEKAPDVRFVFTTEE